MIMRKLSGTFRTLRALMTSWNGVVYNTRKDNDKEFITLRVIMATPYIPSLVNPISEGT
jgi:hypothetical protein